MTALPLPLPADENRPPERPARMKRWAPKKWEVMHQEIVALSVMGMSNIEIAKRYNYSAQQICNILNCPQAVLERRKMLTALEKGIEEKLPQRLEQLADKAIQRMAEVMYNDELAGRSPFAMFDRGVTILKGLGKMDGGEGGNGANKGITMSEELGKRLIDGLFAAAKARELHPQEVVVEAKVITDGAKNG